MDDPSINANQQRLSIYERCLLGAILGALAYIIMGFLVTARWQPLRTDLLSFISCAEDQCVTDYGQVLVSLAAELCLLPGFAAGLISGSFNSNTAIQRLLALVFSSLPSALLGALLASGRKGWSCIVSVLIALWLVGGMVLLFAYIMLEAFICASACAG